MQYLITFLEGIISFISPCMLPMLPIYVSYFAAGGGSRRKLLPRVLAFVLGFTLVFTALGLFAGTLGRLLLAYRRVVNLICGVVVILFGLSYLEVFHLPFFKGMKGGKAVNSVLSAFLFGAIYSISLTPCVGAFLGSALMLASSSGGALKGAALLLVYSAGLGLPFALSALLLDRLRQVFSWIKSHYRVINTICGGFLILVGIAMATGWLNSLLSVFSS